VPTTAPSAPNVISPNDILTVAELAARLKVKPTWVYEKMRPRTDNPLPVWKMGRYLRFSWEQVSTWLQAQARPAAGVARTRRKAVAR
jgi:excisionase family DNA binding protein